VARLDKTYGLIALMVLVVTLMHYNTAMHIHAAHGIYRRLYYFPIIVAAFHGGRNAGLATALAICLLYIPHAFGLIGYDPAPTLEKVLEMALYLAVGLVTGTLEDRDRRTRHRLQHSLDERERLERELVQRERLAAVGQLSAGLAHEIRNPLASIKGATEMLQDHEPAATGRGRMLAIVHEETARLNDVLGRFLDFARPSTGERGRFDLVAELTEVVELIRHRDRAPQVTLDLRTDRALVHGDRTGIRQLLLNLLLNAAEAAGPAPTGTVQVSLTATGSGQELAVVDNGPGFSAEALASLGTPFFTTREGGTGLGLATSLRIAADHGGELVIDDAHQGGARVVVRLPAAGEDT
jgi:two-component system sensor histidine kinase HydH